MALRQGFKTICKYPDLSIFTLKRWLSNNILRQKTSSAVSNIALSISSVITHHHHHWSRRNSTISKSKFMTSKGSSSISLARDPCTISFRPWWTTCMYSSWRKSQSTISWKSRGSRKPKTRGSRSSGRPITSWPHTSKPVRMRKNKYKTDFNTWKRQDNFTRSNDRTNWNRSRRRWTGKSSQAAARNNVRKRPNRVKVLKENRAKISEGAILRIP